MRGGGGSRGSRSSSSGRGSSRMSSSSRRHYGRRGGYYGGGYYGRRRGYYGYGGFNPFAIIIFIFFIGIIIIAAIAAAIGGSAVISDDLQPGEMMIINSDSYVKATMTGGTIITYFYKSRPQVNGMINYNFSGSKTMQNDGDFAFWEDFYASGSMISLSWTSDGEIDFFLVVGKSNFDKWKEGDATQIDQSSGTSGTIKYTTTSDTNVYFAFENSSFNSKTVNADFQIEVPIYDTTTAEKSISGSFSDQAINHKFLLVENTGLSVAVFTLELGKQFEFWSVFLILLVLYILFLYWLGKKLFGKKDKSVIRRQNVKPITQSQLHQTKQSYRKPAKAQPTYVQRPQPKYCGNCGTSVLPGTKFCPACGNQV